MSVPRRAYELGVDLGTTFLAAALLTDETIRALTSRVAADGEAPADVARSWLQDAGFIRG